MFKETVTTYWPLVEVLLEAQVSDDRALKGAKVLASLKELDYRRLYDLYLIYSRIYSV
jgi:hypothetical protein